MPLCNRDACKACRAAPGTSARRAPRQGRGGDGDGGGACGARGGHHADRQGGAARRAAARRGGAGGAERDAVRPGRAPERDRGALRAGQAARHAVRAWRGQLACGGARSALCSCRAPTRCLLTTITPLGAAHRTAPCGAEWQQRCLSCFPALTIPLPRHSSPMSTPPPVTRTPLPARQRARGGARRRACGREGRGGRAARRARPGGGAAQQEPAGGGLPGGRPRRRAGRRRRDAGGHAAAPAGRGGHAAGACTASLAHAHCLLVFSLTTLFDVGGVFRAAGSACAAEARRGAARAQLGAAARVPERQQKPRQWRGAARERPACARRRAPRR